MIFLLIGFYMLGKIHRKSVKKVDFRILVFILPILFMFSNIEPLKGEALKNMSYDVLSNSNRIAKANLNSTKADDQTEAQKIDSALSSAPSAFDDSKQTQSTGSEAVKPQDNLKENMDLEGKEKEEAANKDQNLKSAQLQGDDNSTQSEKENNNEIAQSEGYVVVQDHNVVNNSSIIIDTNVSTQDEPLYLPSVSETKGKNYDIEKFLDDMLEAYSFTGDGSNKFDHQEFEIVGFVYRDDYFDSNRFMVGRILLTCCISDAQQIGVLVEGTEDYTQKFKDDSWVKVRGRLYWQELYNPNTKEDIKVLTLKPSKIDQIEDIAYPYVYFE